MVQYGVPGREGSARVLVQLRDQDTGLPGEILARAFQDDPLFAHILPDAQQRAVALGPFLAWNVRYGQMFGEVLTLPGPVEGAVILLHPSDDHFSEHRLAQSGFGAVAEALGDMWSRFDAEFSRLFGFADEQLARATDHSHWYLDVIGVEPTKHGHGVGGKLLDGVNRRADAAGAPVALLTYQPTNLPFYERNGYELVCHAREPESRLPFWGYRRHPIEARSRLSLSYDAGAEQVGRVRPIAGALDTRPESTTLMYRARRSR